MPVPAAVLALPLLVGCAAGILTFDNHPQLFPLLTAIAALLAWLAAAAAYGDGFAPECTVAVIVGAIFTGLSLGASAARQAYDPPIVGWFEALPETSRGEPIWIEASLIEDALITASGVSLTLRVWTARQAGNALVCARACGGLRVLVAGEVARGRAHEWRAGGRVHMHALLRRPAVHRNPGVADEARALARRGVALAGTVKSAALVEVARVASPIDTAAAGVRDWARLRLSARIGIWSERSAAIATAILIGDRTGLSAEDERRLQRAGTYHVIAISGGNIAILAALLLGVFTVVPVSPRSAAALTIVALLFYGRIAGAAASVDRAVTVAVLYLVARFIDRPGPPLNALAVACVLAMAHSPVAALDPGFILSFGATAAIVVGVARMLPVPVRSQGPTRGTVRRIGRIAAGLLAATVCADLALMPVTATLFSRVTFAGLVLNFAAVPLMAAVQAASLTVLALADLAPRAAMVCGYVVHLAATGLVESARLVDLLPWLAREVLPPAWWLVGAYYGALLVLLASPRYRGGALWVSVACAAAIVAGLPMTSDQALGHPSRGVLRVAVLDVGQGDSTLVALPGGRTLLVDAGGLPGAAFDVGERVVLPALRALRVRRLDTFVLTHGDPDHIGGGLSVLSATRPRLLWEGIPVPPHEELRAMAAAAGGSGASWRYLQAGDVEREGDVEISVLHPPPPVWERQRVRNEDSVVLEVRLGDVAIILPGDVGREGEQHLLQRVSEVRTVILKAPHHGSATSSTKELLDAIRPAVVVFSAGRGNRFGHPHPAVVARYRSLGTHIFSTQDDGAVIVETDGATTEVRGWYSGRGVILGR